MQCGKEQEIVDKVLESVKDEFIPKSVIEDIKAEIDAELKELNAISFYEASEHSKDAYYEIKQAISKIFDKYISGKEKEC